MPQVTFHSRYSNYELVRVCKDDRAIGVGSGNTSWINAERGIKYRFSAAPDPSQSRSVDSDEEARLIGVCTVQTGQNRLIDGSGWLAPDEEQGVERDDVEALMAHYMFAKARNGEVGTGDFWLAGYEPEAKLPLPKDFRRDYIQAGVALDEEKILTMLRDELATHSRPDLVTEAEAALEQVRGERAKIAAAQAEREAANTWTEEDTNKRLQEVCDLRGLTVVGTGANGLVKKDDLVKALRESEAETEVPA